MTQAWTSTLEIDRQEGDLEGQVYRVLRKRILAGNLRPGEALPSTRALGQALGLARSTVVAGYDRLRAEGFVQASAGSVTRVASLPPGPLGDVHVPHRELGAEVSPVEPARFMPLRPGLPDLDAFPHAVWARCLGARARNLRLHDMGYGDEQGLPAMREAVLEHVRRTRAVVASVEQVVILPSTAAGLALLARLALKPGDGAVIEDPGYPTARALLREAGARLLPVPVDSQGLCVEAIPADAAAALAYVTPSHQYPTGAAMTLARRLALLDWARASGALIVEDDYDSEFHYAGRPLAALQGLDGEGQVAYLGTFSKVLAPGLRMAYAIVPQRLLAPLQAAMRLSGGLVPIQVQAAMADFIAEGHLGAHIRRMRKVYHQRMLDTAKRLEELAQGRAGPLEGGLQLALWLADPGADDLAHAARLQAQGLGVLPLSPMFLGPARAGLLFGIATASPPVLARL